jgi:hypothetical protein
MKTTSKIRLYGYLDRLFPIWALKRQARVIYQAFEADLAKAKAGGKTDEYESLWHDQHFETREYEDKILSIQSHSLQADAKSLFIYIPDLQWERGNYGDRYLDTASLSKLHHAVKEVKNNIREYRLKLAAALTGVIGVLIGLIAIWKK